MTTPRLLLLSIVASILVLAPAAAQDFRWEDHLSPGQTLEIKGLNGRVDATPGTSALVTAVKTATESDPESVTIEVVSHADGVTICAVYPGDSNSCLPGQGGRMRNFQNDTIVDFAVQVPPGVHFVARTVNGGVGAQDLAGPVQAYTVNGNIDIRCREAAQARTVNGSITASFERLDGAKSEFKTVNGAISLQVPETLGAYVEAESVNGALESDFDLSTRGRRWGPQKMQGHIGSGDAVLNLKTVNGAIQVRSLH